MEALMHRHFPSCAPLLVWLAAGVFPGAPVAASDIEPPKVQVVDKFGVNLANGQVTHSLGTVSIGGALGLAHRVSVLANEFNYSGYRGFQDRYFARARNVALCTSPASCAPLNVMRVHDFDDTANFAYYVNGALQQSGDATSGYSYLPTADERHSLTVEGDDLVWTKPNGTVVRFYRGSSAAKRASLGGLLTSVLYPNGFAITVTNGGVSVNTNTGFQLRQFFEPDNRPMDKPNNPNIVAPPLATSAASGWSLLNPKYIRGINAAVEYCPWSSADCPLTHSWPTATFSWPPGMPRTMYLGDSTVKVTDAGGLTTSYKFRAYDLAYNQFGSVVPPYVAGREFSPRLVGIAPPGATATKFTYDYENLFAPNAGTGLDIRLQSAGIVKSATRLGAVGSYDMLFDFNGETQNSSNGVGGVTRVHLQGRFGDPGAPYYVDTEDGRVWYEETARAFIRQFDRNAAPRENYTYTRGNLTSITFNAATASAYTKLAEYPASCTPATRKTCNEAVRLRDANGNWTDYTYHAESGQVASITYPANKNGLRPQSRFEYEPKSAHYYDSAGAWISGAPIWMKTAEKFCVNSGAANGVCVGGDEVVTRFEYNHNNLLLTGMTVREPGGVIHRTCYRYDIYGNQSGVTTPNANLGSCP